MKLTKMQLREMIRDLVPGAMSKTSIQDRNERIRLQTLHKLSQMLDTMNDLIQDAFEEESEWRPIETLLNRVHSRVITHLNGLEPDPMNRVITIKYENTTETNPERIKTTGGWSHQVSDDTKHTGGKSEYDGIEGLAKWKKEQDTRKSKKRP
jgi:hypothetical protein